MGWIRAQWEREQEEARANAKKKETQTPQGSRSLYVLLGAGALVLMFPLLQMFRSPLATMPAVNLDARATQLAMEQDNLRINMTQMAGMATDQAQEALREMERQQNTIKTQIAAPTQTAEVVASSTAWSLTQTPLAQEQILRDIELQKKQNEAYWNQFVSPLKVIGWALFVGAALIILLYLGVQAFHRLMPVLETRLRVVKEDGHERTIHIGDNTITRTDLMHAPVLTTQKDGTAKPSGGAPDSNMQERIADRAAKVKAVQALPPGTKLPGNVPPKKADEPTLPELDVVDAEEIKPALLKDVRQSLDAGEESGS